MHGSLKFFVEGEIKDARCVLAVSKFKDYSSSKMMSKTSYRKVPLGATTSTT